MNNEEKGNSLEPEDIGAGSKLETTKLPEAGPEDGIPRHEPLWFHLLQRNLSCVKKNPSFFEEQPPL